MKFIIGKKVGMTQIYDKEGNAVPVTVIEAGPCFVTQIKTKDKDGYESVQIGLDAIKEKKITKNQKGKAYRFLKEFSVKTEADSTENYKVGDKITVETFLEGEKLRVSGISKGRGFQGVVKRHGFKGGPASHGHPHSLRKPGSIGCSFPERVIKGMRMAGHMGVAKQTIKNIKVAAVDVENNLLAVSGPVAGYNGGLVEIRVI
jgi:large subunit ribosomal protein L3